MIRTMTPRIVAALLALGLCSTGCFSRLHMSDKFGRANRQAFERQAVNPPSATSAKTPKGLDALEAGIVVETYRTGLGPAAAGQQGNQTILLSPNGGSMGYPSSVSPPSK